MVERAAPETEVDPFTKWVLTCPKIPLVDYVQFCFGKPRGRSIADPWARVATPVTTQDLVSILCALGVFEPRGATEPRACDVVTAFDDMIELPVAVLNAAGEVVPSQKKAVKICAPQHRSLVVDFLEVLPANLTAWESGEVFSKALQVPGFSEMLCPPGEPGDGGDIGVFSNIRRIVLCPGAGFDLSVRNHSLVSPALFHVKATMWSTC